MHLTVRPLAGITRYRVGPDLVILLPDEAKLHSPQPFSLNLSRLPIIMVHTTFTGEWIDHISTFKIVYTNHEEL